MAEPHSALRARRFDLAGQPLCFVCGKTQSEHPGGSECPEQPAQSSSHYEVSVDRWALYRVLDMPGLARIDMHPKVAVLTFETAPGCEPAGLEFVASEVWRISGGHVLGAHERG